MPKTQVEKPEEQQVDGWETVKGPVPVRTRTNNFDELHGLLAKLESLPQGEYLEKILPSTEDVERLASRLRGAKFFKEKVQVMQRGNKVILVLRENANGGNAS